MNCKTRSNDGDNNRNGGGCNMPRRTKQYLTEGSSSRFLQQDSLFLHLPPEIISLILVRLRVKILLIMKSVSKHFTRLISSPDFIGEHLKFSSEDAFMSGYKAIVRPTKKGFCTELVQISIQSLCLESSIHAIDLVYPEEGVGGNIRLVGSCNGLVFEMENWKNMFLWNPAIRKHKKLQDVKKLESLEENYLDFSYYGFGFDVSNDDYKVVVLALESRSKKCHAVCVYSLKRSCWRRIPDFVSDEFLGRFGKFASGQLHWSTISGDVVSFDVEREVFGTLEQPSCDKGIYGVALSVLGNPFVCAIFTINM